MTNEEKNFFNLIESWDDTNIDLALQMMKGNKALKAAAQDRYAQALTILKRKTVKSLKGMPKKWDKASRSTKIKLLEHLPVLEGTPVKKAMNQFIASLKALDYYNDKTLVQLPSFLPQLDEVKYINAKYCGLQSLPLALFQLSKLARINLIGNLVKELPELNDTAATQVLILAQNNLQEWSVDIGKHFPELTALYLHHNKLKNIDFGEQASENLTVLSLSNNQLSSLPKSIGNCKKLEELHLSNNPLQILPDNISQLVNLRYLSIANTPLAENKEYLAQLKAALTNTTIIHRQLNVMPIHN